jgi:hypothetical protein
MRHLWLLAFLSAAGCGSTGDGAAGSKCITSADCGPGLLCDFGKKPAVCATMDTVVRDLAKPDDQAVPDMPMMMDLAGVDLAGRDLAVPIRDMAVKRDMAVPRDMATPDDMSQTD